MMRPSKHNNKKVSKNYENKKKNTAEKNTAEYRKVLVNIECKY